MSKQIRLDASEGFSMICGTEIRGERSEGWQRFEVMCFWFYVCVACALDTNGASLLQRVTEVGQ